MTKTDAIRLFGSVRELAAALDITHQAIYQWEDELPQAQIDRITGAALRLGKLPGRRTSRNAAAASCAD